SRARLSERAERFNSSILQVNPRNASIASACSLELRGDQGGSFLFTSGPNRRSFSCRAAFGTILASQLNLEGRRCVRLFNGSRTKQNFARGSAYDSLVRLRDCRSSQRR